jgi:hypothetical protein
MHFIKKIKNKKGDAKSKVQPMAAAAAEETRLPTIETKNTVCEQQIPSRRRSSAKRVLPVSERKFFSFFCLIS